MAMRVGSLSQALAQSVAPTTDFSQCHVASPCLIGATEQPFRHPHSAQGTQMPSGTEPEA